MVSREELKVSLKLYRDSIGEERLKVKEEKRQPVQAGQLRVLFWQPEEYVLVYHVEEEGLAYCVPLTVWASLSTVPLRLHTANKLLAPLPFVVYLRRELLEEESVPIALVREDTIHKVLKSVERAPTWSAKREKREFIRLVWKRYQDLSLASLLFTHLKREA